VGEGDSSLFYLGTSLTSCIVYNIHQVILIFMIYLPIPPLFRCPASAESSQKDKSQSGIIPCYLWMRHIQCSTTTLCMSVVLVVIILFLSFSSKVGMPAELPGYPTTNAMSWHTDVPRARPFISWGPAAAEHHF